MKILVVESGRTIGGGQIVTKEICNVLSEKNDVSILIPDLKSYQDFFKDIRQFKYRLRAYNRGKKSVIDLLKFLFNNVVLFFTFFRLFKKEKFDLIYVQHVSIIPILIIILNFFRIKCIAHIHVVYSDKKTHNLLNRCLNKSLITKIVGVSYYAIEQFTINDVSKTIVLRNPIKVINKQGAKTLSHTLAIVGDVIWNKGTHIAVNALKLLDDTYSLHIIGSCIDDEYLKCLLQDVDPKKIKVAGFVKNVPQYLLDNNIDIVTVCSVIGFETFSLAMVEAWGLGIPTLATDGFGMKELVETYLPKYKNDMLFKCADHIDLAQKIVNLENNQEYYHRLSNDLYEIVQEHLTMSKFRTDLNNLIANI